MDQGEIGSENEDQEKSNVQLIDAEEGSFEQAQLPKAKGSKSNKIQIAAIP